MTGRSVRGLPARDPLGRAEWVTLGLASVFVVAASYLVWPAFGRPFIRTDASIDTAVFAYAGELLRTGGAPYVAYWDHKPPLVHLFSALGLALGGLPGVWTVSVTAVLLAVVIGHLAMREIAGPAGAIAGTAVFACSFPAIPVLSLTEGYLLPVQMASILVVARGGAPRRALALGAAAGTLSALGFFLRANLLSAGALAAGALLVTHLWRREGGAAVRVAVGAALGAAAVGAVVVGYVVSRGALAPFVDQVFRYNFGYASARWSARVTAAIGGVRLAAGIGTLALPVFGWLVAARGLSAQRAAAPPALGFALAWPIAELALGAMSGRQYSHYFAPLLPPFALLTAIGIGEVVALLQQAGAGRPLTRGVGSLLLAGVGVSAAAFGTVELFDRTRYESRQVQRNGQVLAAAAYLREHLPAAAPAYVWGDNPDVYLFSGRRAASRYIYPLPLLTPGYADSALVAGFIRELDAAAPPVILDATNPAIDGGDVVPPLGRWDPAWQFPSGSRAPYWTATPALRAYYRWVADHYAVTDSVGPGRWAVYTRRTPGVSRSAAGAPAIAAATTLASR